MNDAKLISIDMNVFLTSFFFKRKKLLHICYMSVDELTVMVLKDRDFFDEVQSHGYIL